MRNVRVHFKTQTREVSGTLAIEIAGHARTLAEHLEMETEPQRLTEGLVKLCDALADAIRAAAGLDEGLAILQSMRRALDGEDFELIHEATRECRDLRIHLEAVQRIAPEAEGVPEVVDFREELAQAIDSLGRKSKDAWARILGASRIASWQIARALRGCDDVGHAVRALRIAGLLPRAIDPGLCFGPVADPRALEGSPAHNAARAVAAFTAGEAFANQDRAKDAERAGREITEKIRAMVAQAEAA